MSEYLTITVPDGDFQALVVRPAQEPVPAIVLIQEIFGVNDHIRTVADQYALDGYVVLAPDLFWRKGHRVDLGYGPADFQKGIDLMMGLDGAKALADLAARFKALAADCQDAEAIQNVVFEAGKAANFEPYNPPRTTTVSPGCGTPT